MAVKGVFASDSGIVGDRKGDFASSLLKVMPNGTAPLLALTSGMKSADAQDTVITWFEENHETGRVGITNAASTGTSIVVSTNDATVVIAGQIYLVESTGEYIFINSVSSVTATVTRGFAGTTNTTVDGSSTVKYMQLIANAQEEGSSKPTAIATIGFPVFNYMQIFRNTWQATGTAQAVAFHTGNVMAKNRKDNGMFHSEAIEKSIIWGKKSLGIQNSQPFRTMDGILSFFTTNVSTQSTNVSYTDLRGFLEGVFSHNIDGEPNERIAFCGHDVLSVVDTIAHTHTQFNVDETTTGFGMDIKRLRTPFGNISLMTHPLMVENPVWTKDLYVMHPAAIRVRYLRRTHEDNYDADGRRAGVDADYGVLTTEMSLEYKGERTGGSYTGIDTPDTSAL